MNEVQCGFCLEVKPFSGMRWDRPACEECFWNQEYTVLAGEVTHLPEWPQQKGSEMEKPTLGRVTQLTQTPMTTAEKQARMAEMEYTLGQESDDSWKAFTKPEEIKLGHHYKDKVHGVQGIATCHSRYLTGCDRVCLEAVTRDGEIKEYWLDVNRLEKMDEIAYPPAEVQTQHAKGGPGKVAPKGVNWKEKMDRMAAKGN